MNFISYLSCMREFSLLSSSSWNLLLFDQVIGPSMLSPSKPNSSSLDSPLSDNFDTFLEWKWQDRKEA